MCSLKAEEESLDFVDILVSESEKVKIEEMSPSEEIIVKHEGK